MVGREPPPPPLPRPRWINIVLIIAGVGALCASTGVAVHLAHRPDTQPPPTSPPAAVEQHPAPAVQPGFKTVDTTVSCLFPPGESPGMYASPMRTETCTEPITRQGVTMWLTPAAVQRLQPEPPYLEFYTSVPLDDPILYQYSRHRHIPGMSAGYEACTIKVMRCGQPLYVTPALAAVLLPEPGNDGWVAVDPVSGSVVPSPDQQLAAAQPAKQNAGNRDLEAQIQRLEDEWRALLAQLSPKDRDAAMAFLLTDLNGTVTTAKGEVISREAKIAKVAAGIPSIRQIVQLLDQVQELRNAQHGVSTAALTPEQELAAERQRVVVYDDKGNPLPGYGAKAPGLVFNIVEGTGEVRRIDSNDKDALFAGPRGATSAAPVYTGPGVVQANGDVVIHQGKRADAIRPSRPPVIPDPIGLGERLVLIDILVEKFGQRRADLVNPKWTYADLVELYWVQVRQSGRPAPFPEAPAVNHE